MRGLDSLDEQERQDTISTSEVEEESVFLNTFNNLRGYFHKEKIRTLPDYDQEVHGSLIEYEVPEEYTQVEQYWLDEPYALVSILQKKNQMLYQVIEPALTVFEKEILERIYDDLQDILTLTDTSTDVDKSTILQKKALTLLDYYHASLEVASIHKILYYLERNLRGYDKLNPLILDPNIEDISCDGNNIPIFLYHIAYRNIKTNIAFDETELNSFVIRICQKCGKQISIGEPMIDATMPDGSRLQATLGKEVTTRGSSFSIRKFRGDPITPIDLVKFNTCDIDMIAYLWLVTENGKSILFAGGTASGKTSMLNSVSLFIPSLVKIISIEDTRELMLHHDNWIAGLSRESFTVSGAGEVSMYDLLRSALRQRPEYIIVGEVRGKEALTLFQAMSTGHTTYSTMHAGDVQTVVSRLEHEPINVPHVMMQSLNIICIQKQVNLKDERVRRTNNVVEVAGLDPKSGNIRINECFQWDPSTDTFKFAGNSIILDNIMFSRGWDKDTLLNELNNRKKILAYMCDKNMRDFISVSMVVQAYSVNPELVLNEIENDTLQEMFSHSI
ncbi:MAG: type II/IV secretion system ATPase subunit [Methanosarcinales archaeon]|nr:type II/IV secretion system ATPase subunit [Methanosarcinales archaeon]